MSNVKDIYTKLDEKIDKYLGTANLRPGPQKKLINRRVLGPDENIKAMLNKNHNNEYESKIDFNSNPIAVEKINWQDLVGVHKQSKVSDSVFYLQFLNNKLLLLKATTEIPLLLFGNIIAKSFLIDTPNCRVIEYQNPEYAIIIENIKRVTHSEKSIYNSIVNEIQDKLFLMLIEYIPCLFINELNSFRSKLIFSDKNYNSRRIFISIGRTFGIDILLNNSQIIPSTLHKDVNVKNSQSLNFRVNPDSILPNSNFKNNDYLEIFIDSAIVNYVNVSCLNPNDKFDLKKLGEYLNNISEFMKEFFYEMKCIICNGNKIETFQFKIFSSYVQFFLTESSYSLTNQNIFHMAMGLITILDDITRVEIEDIEKIILFVQLRAINKDWADSFKSNSKLLYVDYFKYLVNYIKQVKTENESVFNWVDDITQGFYSADFVKNYVREIERHESFKKFEEKKSNKITSEKIVPKIEEKKNILDVEQKNFDDFNFNKNDKKTFRNDVHNGIYDLMNIDDKMILETVKREFILEKKKEIEVKDFKKYPDKNDANVIETNTSLNFIENRGNSNSSYKKYTRDELKDKIKRDELKETLKIKKNFNPEEGKFLEEKIKEVDEDFFNETKSNLNMNMKMNMSDENIKSLNSSKKEFTNIVPKRREEK